MKKTTIVPIALIALLMVSRCIHAISVLSGGADFLSSPTITMQSTRVEISGTEKFFRFIPAETGLYEIYSTGTSGDPIGCLYNETGTLLDISDDGNGYPDFLLAAAFTAGHTYYVGIRGWNGNTGDTTLVFSNALANPDSSITLTDENISISGATGTGGIFIAGDTLTAFWNNTSSGDNNTDIVSVTIDFTEFGGNTVAASPTKEGIWSAAYIITEDSTDGTGLNVSVTATDSASCTASTGDTTGATVDATIPRVLLSDDKTTDSFRMGDTVTITADFSEPMADSPLITITGTDVVNESMTGGGTRWTYVWTAPSDNASTDVMITGYDLAGNTCAGPASLTYRIDNRSPMISGVSDGGKYAGSRRIYFNEGSAILNGRDFKSGSLVERPGEYIITVTDGAGNTSSASFSICLETVSFPYDMPLAAIERIEERCFTDIILNIDSDVLACLLFESNAEFVCFEISANPYDSSERHYRLRLTLEDIEMMIDKKAAIGIFTPVASLTLDPSIIDPVVIRNTFPNTAASDINVLIGIKPAYAAIVRLLTDKAAESGLMPAGPSVAVEFKFTDGKTTLSRTSLKGSYELAIPFPAEESAVATAARLMPDMTLRNFKTETTGIHAVITTDMSGIFTLFSE